MNLATAKEILGPLFTEAIQTLVAAEIRSPTQRVEHLTQEMRANTLVKFVYICESATVVQIHAYDKGVRLIADDISSSGELLSDCIDGVYMGFKNRAKVTGKSNPPL